jgi:hypothetical protein
MKDDRERISQLEARIVEMEEQLTTVTPVSSTATPRVPKPRNDRRLGATDRRGKGGSAPSLTG